MNFASTQLQEEQERKLPPEIEQERQVQKPSPAEPEGHNLHLDLRSFVSTGILKKPSNAYKPAFGTLRNTSAASYLDVSQFPSELCVTDDFATTIQVPTGHASSQIATSDLPAHLVTEIWQSNWSLQVPTRRTIYSQRFEIQKRTRSTCTHHVKTSASPPWIGSRCTMYQRARALIPSKDPIPSGSS